MNSLKLRTLPLQLIEIDDGVLLKRGNTILNVNGKGAKTAVPLVLSKLNLPGSTQEEVAQNFSGPEQQAVNQFIEKLISNKLAVTADTPDPQPISQESHLDIFYWHFGDSTGQVTERLNRQHVTIVGVNHISRQLSAAFVASGVDNFEIVDDPILGNTRMLNHKGAYREGIWNGSHQPKPLQEWKNEIDPALVNCVIATSDFGGLSLLREWNQFCVDRKIFFMPVVLQDQVGYVGPLVIPGETACLECLLARQDSHRSDSERSRSIEESAHEGQSVIGFHPSMASILGDLAAFELTKFFSGVLPGWNVGTILEINLLSTRMTSRKVLKVPRCPVCSPLLTRTPINPHKAFSLLPVKDKP